jgi:Domain of unknown function (DUF4349)
MAIVAGEVQNRLAESVDVPGNEVLAERENKHESPGYSPALAHFSDWKAWAIGGATAVALIATASIAIFNNAGRPDTQQVQTMGYVKTQVEGVLPPVTRLSNQAATQALRAPAAKSVGVMQNAAITADRSTPAANLQAPMIARTASVTILVNDFAAARASLDTILVRHGGYDANLAIDTPENGQRHFQASLRIPANRLDLALTDLKNLGRTLNESQSGEEVTQQHANLVARLQNSRETEQRLRAILEQRTGKIYDVLQVEQEIDRVRGEIESMEAEQKALEHRVVFAGVDLQLVEEYKERFSSSPISTSGRLRNAFVEGMRNASGTVLGLVLFLAELGPSILIWSAILGLPAFFVWRRYRKLSAHF